MTVGLPGVGIGGIFYLISALLMPIHESIRTFRGESSAGRWRVVATHWTLAAAIVAALWATGWVLGLIVPAAAIGIDPAASSVVARNVIEVGALALSLGTLTLVLLAVHIARLLVGSRDVAGRHRPMPIQPVPDPRSSTHSPAEFSQAETGTNGRRGDSGGHRRRSFGHPSEAG
jgi:hypothetical protein